jgi:hypothetical protein
MFEMIEMIYLIPVTFCALIIYFIGFTAGARHGRRNAYRHIGVAPYVKNETTETSSQNKESERFDALCTLLGVEIVEDCFREQKSSYIKSIKKNSILEQYVRINDISIK